MTDMRKQYDFSKGVRGVHAARFREGTRIVVTDSGSDLETLHDAAIEPDERVTVVKKRGTSVSPVRLKNS